MQSGAAETCSRRKSQMLQRECVFVCASSCASYTIMTLILRGFADVTFKCNPMYFPEGIGALNVRLGGGAQTDAENLNEIRALSDCRSLSDGKDRCVI